MRSRPASDGPAGCSRWSTTARCLTWSCCPNRSGQASCPSAPAAPPRKSGTAPSGACDRFDLVISTFGGNAAACAAGLKAIEITLRDDLAGRAAALGQHAAARLRELTRSHESVKAIHGKGLLLGVELSSPISGAAMDENFALMVASSLLNDHGVLTTYFDLAPNVLRFEPPLIVSEAEIDYAIDAFDGVLGLGVGGLALSAGKNAIERILHRAG